MEMTYEIPDKCCSIIRFNLYKRSCLAAIAYLGWQTAERFKRSCPSPAPIYVSPMLNCDVRSERP